MAEITKHCCHADAKAETRSKVWRFLRALSPEARNRWSETVTCIRIAKQIREMRKARGWTQETLAEVSGLHVVTINRLERRTGSGIKRSGTTTLSKIAAAFDCALIIRFVSWGEWVEWIITPLGAVKSFQEEHRQ